MLYEMVRDHLATLLADVFTCVRCGGRRQVVAYLTAPNGVRAILEHLELPSLPGRLAPAQGHPKARGAEPKEWLLPPAQLQASSSAAPRLGRQPGLGRHLLEMNCFSANPVCGSCE
ncbi:hypothetical protein [Archangium sp.]|uniref:hypothetical protein n=1 Tax=Archangium sp. TaxID=1872627 RepID=UPI002D63DDCE|nr:hypothetical protein [Archangium sp.]HYO52944.1 hypothetical protein [Archangium sp.]